MKITVKSEEKVGSKNHSAKRFCSYFKLDSLKVVLFYGIMAP